MKNATTAWSLSNHRNLIWWITGLSLVGLVYLTNVSIAESLQRFDSPWYYMWQQVRWIVLGLVAFVVTSRFSLNTWRSLAPIMFWSTVALLVAVLVSGFGSSALGAQRWLQLGPIRIQPSEFTKLAVVVFFAQWLERHQKFGSFLSLTALLFTLILLQPNLSTACIVVALATAMYFYAGGEWKPIAIFAGLGVLAVALLIVAAPYRRARLMTFLNPASDPLGSSYHIRQITLALGRGGWFGQGLGMSKQKYQYIPEASSDSVFAIFGEEMGFIGSTALLGIMAVFVIGLMNAAREQNDKFASLLIAGMATWIGLHVAFNVAAMVALIPLTGIPFPFFSRGGSLYLAMMTGLGVTWRALKDGNGKNSHQPPRRRFAHRLKSR